MVRMALHGCAPRYQQCARIHAGFRRRVTMVDITRNSHRHDVAHEATGALLALAVIALFAVVAADVLEVQWMQFIGRILFVAIFLSSGIKPLTQRAGMVEYGRMSNLPLPEVAVPVTGLMLIA